MVEAAKPDSNPPSVLTVEVAYAEADRQFLRRFDIAAGGTVADAIARSGVEREFGIDTQALAVGIWSRVVAPETPLRQGDRVELYRPLNADPKESRRRRAQRNPLVKPR